jgi:hypothetical protein
MTWGGLDEIFNPGAAHFREEMDRKRIEARIPGNEGGPNTVDLEKGVVRITLTRKQDAVADAPQDAVTETLQDAPAPTPQDAVHWPAAPQDAV